MEDVMKLRIQELEDKIKSHSTQYYLGESEISDYQFDALVEELQSIDPDNEVLTSTGWGLDLREFTNKLPHQYVMKGLPKVKRELDDLISTDPNVYSTYKMDGCAVEIILSTNGILAVVTRGDGEVGQNVTSKFTKLWNKDIDYSKLFTEHQVGSLTAEVCLANEFRSPGTVTHTRNIVAGMLSSNDVNSINDNVKVLVHGITYYNSRTDDFETSRYEDEKLLRDYFQLVPHVTSHDGLTYGDTVGSQVVMIDGNSYSVDGVVESPVNSVYNKGHLDQTSIAVKVVTESAVSTIVDYRWNLTRTGKYVPVIEIEPVTLNGAIICNVSGNSASYLETKGLGIGAKVEIVRSGEIIPIIQSVLETAPVELPTKCSKCGCELVRESANLECQNEECEGILVSSMIHFIGTVTEIDGLGPNMIKDFIEDNLYQINKVADLYTMDIEKYRLPNANDASFTSRTLWKMINQVRSQTDFKLIIMGLGIPAFGWGSYDKCGKSLYEFILDDSIEVLDRPKGVRVASIEWITEHRSYLKELVEMSGAVHVEEVVQEVTGDIIPICITGSLVKFPSRNKIVEVYPNVKIVGLNEARYLVTNSNKMTSKYRTAMDKGIEIINEEELYKILG